MSRIAIFLLTAALVQASLHAAPPEIAAISPAGGQRGSEVRVACQGKLPAETQVWTSHPGVQFVGVDGNDAIRLKLSDDVPPGRHWIRVYSNEGAAALRPFVVGTCPELAESEPNDSLEKSQPLDALPKTLNGVLQKSGDVDSFAVTLTAGQTLVATLAARQELSSPLDGVLQVADARGFVVAQNDDASGFDPQVVYQAAKDGTYHVRAFAFPASPDSSIRFSGAATYIYRLTVSSGPFAQGVLPSAVIAKQTGKLQIIGCSLSPGSDSFEFTDLEPGLHRVYPAGMESTASVWASATPISPEQEPNDVSRPQAAAIPACLTGRVEFAKDVDVWKLAVRKGQKLELRAIAERLRSPLDVLVRVLNPGGKLLQEFDDAPRDEFDLAAEFTCPEDGEILVSVADRFGHGGPLYGYVLLVAEAAPDFQLTAAADAFVLKPDASLEIPVTIDVRSGFAEPLDFAIEGLPEGCTFEEGATEEQRKEGRRRRRGGNDKVAKLILKSTREEAWSGPIRIVGRTEGASPLERAAGVNIDPLGRAPHLWLTVLPKAR